jgi:hypothetical protein
MHGLMQSRPYINAAIAPLHLFSYTPLLFEAIFLLLLDFSGNLFYNRGGIDEHKKHTGRSNNYFVKGIQG